MVIQERYEEQSLKFYGLALATVVAFVGFRYALTPLLLNNVPLALLIVAVALSAWLGGRGPGLFATGVAAVLGNFFFLEPFHSFSVQNNTDIMKLSLFALEGAGVTWVTWKCAPLVKRCVLNPVTEWVLEHPIVTLVLAAFALVPFIALGVHLAELNSHASPLKTYGDWFWWTLGVTLRVRFFQADPVTSIGRVLASLQILFGWITFIVVLAKMIAVIAQKRIDRTGNELTSFYNSARRASINIDDRFPFLTYVNALPPTSISGHTVIFGWNEIVKQYIQSNLGTRFTEDTPVIVICQSLTQEMVDFAKELRPKGFLIVEGHNESYVLKRFSVGSAKEILITHPPAAHGSDGDKEVLKLASTVAAINENARIIVEIEQSKYMPYLKDIGVSEIRRFNSHLKLVKKDGDSDHS